MRAAPDGIAPDSASAVVEPELARHRGPLMAVTGLILTAMSVSVALALGAVLIWAFTDSARNDVATIAALATFATAGAFAGHSLLYPVVTRVLSRDSGRAGRWNS